MTILGLCFNGAAHGVPGHHDPLLVLLSYVVAVFASFTALEMAERLRGAQGMARRLWRIAAAVALGGGIWSMHFVAMLAFKIPLTQAYDPLQTAISGLIAIGAVGIGLHMVERSASWPRIGAAGVLVGLGVAVMHYAGMEALRVPGQIYYKPGLFALSVVIAIAAACVALWLANVLRFAWQRGAAALVMGVAICGMHYTGMAATVIVAGPPSLLPVAGTVPAGVLAAAVAIGVIILFCLGLVCALVDRRLERRAILEADRLRALNAALAERTESLTVALAAKSDLLASMSHEFRTPLNAILGFAEVLRLNRKREPLTANQDEAVGYILTNGRHLLTQIVAMLDLAQLDSGQPLVRVENVPLDEILGDVRDSFALQADQAGVTLTIDPAAAKALLVSADRARLGQVIASLVSNGVKYNRAGGEVRLTTARAGDRIEIAVSDNGAGIAEARIAGIFQPFDRLGREGGAILGSGIGLAIGKRLVEAMGGDLRVESVEGEGSTFTVVLPAAAKALALVRHRAA